MEYNNSLPKPDDDNSQKACTKIQEFYIKNTELGKLSFKSEDSEKETLLFNYGNHPLLILAIKWEDQTTVKNLCAIDGIDLEKKL